MNRRLLNYAFCLILILSAIAPVSGIMVGGIRLVTDVSPGDHILHLITVDIGDDGEAVDVVAQLKGCGMALDGSRVQLVPEEDTEPYTARNFLKVTPERTTIEPGTRADFVLEVNVPEDVGAGGRYALVNIATVPVGGGVVGVSSAVEIPVFLTIEGTELIETGEITNMEVSEVEGGLQVDVMLENTGNHHYKAGAEALLVDDEGNVVAEASVPTSENSIIPTYTRLFAIQFDPAEEFTLGTYTVEATVIKEDGTVLDTEETTFEV